MTVKLGKDAVVYYSKTPGTDLQDMGMILDVANVELNISASEVDVTRRSGNGWRQIQTALNDCEVSLEIPLDTSDPGYQALRDAFNDNTVLALAILTGARNKPNEGIVGDFSVTNFPRSEPIDGAVSTNITLKLIEFDKWAETAENTAEVTVSTDPIDGATGVAVSKKPTATFNKAMSAGTVHPGNFVLKKADGTPVETSLSLNGVKKVVTITPTSNLAGDTDYVLTIKNAMDENGNLAPTTVVNFKTV